MIAERRSVLTVRSMPQYRLPSKSLWPQSPVPDSAEMVYWHAVALVNMGRVDESLPLFKKVFAMDSNWAVLTPRLPKSGPQLGDPKLIERILSAAK